QPVGEQRVLGADHVVVGVFRKLRSQAIARLARLSVADAIRQDDEVLRGIENLAWAKQLPAEGPRQEAPAGAAGAMTDPDGIAHHARCVAARRADGAVMQFQFWERFAGTEGEVPRGEVAFDRRRPTGGALATLRERRRRHADERQHQVQADTLRSGPVRYRHLRSFDLASLIPVPLRLWQDPVA